MTVAREAAGRRHGTATDPVAPAGEHHGGAEPAGEHHGGAEPAGERHGGAEPAGEHHGGAEPAGGHGGGGRVLDGRAIAGRRTLRADVCVIGSGAGGAVAAAELAEGGLDVVMVEDGAWRSSEDATARPRDMLARLSATAGRSSRSGDRR